MPDPEVTVHIDGREVQVPRGTLVIEAAKLAGVEIPVFCYHPKLKPVGACRMCLVDIEKMPRLQTACTTPVAEGMIVHSRNDRARDAQKSVIELLLANHPLDCPICDKGGECPLQDNTFKYGLGTSRFYEPKRKLAKALPLSDRIVLDRERCIMCYRCVRFQDEVAGDQALSAIDRAGTSQIGVLEGETFDSPFSGNTIDLCPVGALLSRQYRFRARPWDLQRTPSVCVGCAVGCNVELHARDQVLQRMVPRENMEVNNEWLCDYGRFDTLPIHQDRVRQPLIDGAVAPWQEALRTAAKMLRGGSAEVVASPSLTNEALNALRAISAGLHAPLTVWPAKTGRVRGSIVDLIGSKTIILLGFDVWRELPVLALRIREALKKGAQLYWVGAGENGLRRDTTASYATADALLKALDGAPAGPVSILGPGADDLAQRLEAGGMVGEPPTAANGYAMAELPRANFTADVLLLAGNESWPSRTVNRPAVMLRWADPQLPASSHSQLVLLPILHPYEQTGTVTNLEGRVQELRSGGHLAGEARADWAVLAELGRALGINPAPEGIQPALA
ncbi:MAG TPA: 2Fe-2S iron-sulfur cluster-binding protein [Chloroflexota bacterium]|nr:2Fe-2S iron-sulfur cluster-binding protein [Chloroflexota bacterium]